MPTEVLAGRSGPPGGNPADQKQQERSAMDGAPAKTDEDRRRDDLVGTAGWRVKHRRGQLRWGQPALAHRFREVGRWYSGAPKFVTSLISMISRWEKNQIVPSSYNLHILAEALGVEVGELGFPIDPHYVHPPRRKTPLPLD